MQRRATSKKRAAEAEKEVDMGDKEATPIEDPEVLLNPVEPKQPAPPEEQPEVTTQTGEVNVPEKRKLSQPEEMATQEMFRQVMEVMQENSRKLREDMNKQMESTKIWYTSSADFNNKSIREICYFLRAQGIQQICTK